MSVEDIIQKAIRDGELDNLEGQGKPLDLDLYMKLPNELRSTFQMLKNSGYVPEEVELLNKISELKEKIDNTKDTEEAKKLKLSLQELQLKLSLKLEAYKNLGKS